VQADRSERSVGLIISGEKAFRVILDFFGWAKIPMAGRIPLQWKFYEFVVIAADLKCTFYKRRSSNVCPLYRF
jgi:hypothetical protein